MAKLTSLISFSGTLDGISVYKMEGVEQPVVRRKGGASKEKILHDPCFVNTRRNMEEFGGRSLATRYVLQAFAPVRPGHGTTGEINRVLAAVQKMDTRGAWGKRPVALSLQPSLLRGLNISRRLTLERVLPNSLDCQLSRTTLSARVTIPALLPGINCLHPKTHPFFRLVAVLGAVPDLVYHEQAKVYGPQEGFEPIPAQAAETPWHQANTVADATALELALPVTPGSVGFSLLLSVAVQYGKLGVSGAVEPLPKAVAARVMEVG